MAAATGLSRDDRHSTLPGAGAADISAHDGGAGSRSLRRILVVLDAVAVAGAWLIALTIPDGLEGGGLSRVPNLALALTLIACVSGILLAYQKLYRARVCSVRAVETERLGRTAVLAALLLQASERHLRIPVSLLEALTGAALSFLFLRAGRDGYRSWLNTHRRNGRHSRAIVLIGANEEGFDLYQLIGDHPELGYRVAGVIGDPNEVIESGFNVPWLGDVTSCGTILEAVRTVGANGVLVVASAVPSTQLNRMVRELLCAGIHVHLSSGIRGMDSRRVRSQPLAHEPLFYLEPASLSRWQFATKRGIDVVLAGIAFVLSLPVLAVAALAIKVHDRGPVFFRQERVGRDGRLFTMFKLRTMVVDAEARLAQLREQNQREGALFKLSHDPRITPVGRLLRATSLDELPQLINVIRGEMSLVGPRPALPDEVAQFETELLARHRVVPGITGLWQVEARDSASFRAYQRLDLFYVENWSVGLDVAILFATVQSVAARGLRAFRRRSTGAGNDGDVAALLLD